VEILGGDEDLRGAAAGLFSALDRLERAGLQAIVARLFPETGLGVAINDRLRRAAVDDAQ
jgi:L-threonylcarbamoyladenylate synthase